MERIMKSWGFAVLVIGGLLICPRPASAFFVDIDTAPPLEKQKESPAESHYQTGIQKLAQGDLKQAREAFQKSLKVNSKYVKSILGLAEIAFKEGEVRQAGQYLKDAMSLSPESGDIQTAWARYLYLEKRFSEAEVAFKKALTLAPRGVAAYVDLGDMYMNAMQDTRKAIEAYKGAIDVDPEHAGAHYALGVALSSLGKIEEAQPEFETARNLAPENPLPIQALVRLHLERQEYAKALEYLDALLKFNPKFVPAYLDRGDIHMISGEHEKAIHEYESALKVDSKFSPAYVKIGMVRQIRKQPKEAQEAYRMAIKLNPNEIFAYNNLACVLVENQGDMGEALKSAQKAVELAPGVSQFWDTLGWVERASGDTAKAVTSLEKAVSLPNPTAETYYHLGVVYTEIGKKSEATGAFKKAVEGNQNFPGLEDAQQRLQALQ